MRGYRMTATIATTVVLLCAAPASTQGPAMPPSPSVEYRLGSGDKVKITVYDEAAMTGEYQVSDRGMISLPLMGDFPAAGKTVPEVRAGIAARLANGLVNNPRVTAEVSAFRPFYILGEVNKPGMYAYAPGMTFYRAVATAQGFTYRANARHVLITHTGETQEHRIAVTTATIVLPGDTIRVREKFF